MKAIEILHCQCAGASSRPDGSVRVAFITPELRPSESGALMGLHGKNVTVSIVPEDVAPEELIRVDTEREQKTHSQRLRAVLFVYWQQNVKEGDFNSFYDTKMNSFIDHIKTKLDT